MYIVPKVRQDIMTKWVEPNQFNMNILSWEVTVNVMGVVQFLHNNKEEQVRTYIRKTFMEGYGVIDLDRLYEEDRKSTRLNSSHVAISYAVFCLKKKRKH